MKSQKDIEEEAAKCVVLCRNCHAKLHAGILSVEGLPNLIVKSRGQFQELEVRNLHLFEA